MDRKKYVKELLTALEFDEEENLWEYKYPNLQTSIVVDLENGIIKYPEDKGFIVNERQTCKFSSPENFVVLECVHQLLLKGYRPEHIELERRWSLGHTSKGGRADICVMNDLGTDTLFIIECKTYGHEYENAYRKLHADGGQLFSYLQQEKSVLWLCLYASALDNGELKRCETTISTFDDEKILQLAQNDITIATYQHAKTVEQNFKAWKDTYEQKTHQDRIFSEDTVAYNIGVKPLRKRNLKEFNPQDKIVNQFEEILRHNNVSDKENAFNKLLALFICKIVDEIQKGENDTVEFHYRQGTDTYEDLQDRLQRLHKEGMEKFMREEVFYVSNEYPQELFNAYNGGNRKQAIKDLKETFRKMKFYSNHDFAFKEVHNEELFLQNGKILVEMVRLFENYRIVYKGKHQFLGDLFEQLLNKGFKQNEGQFFTPTPIARFMWESLPLKQIIDNENGELPKVIDYACGAGHFLTEGIESIARVSKRAENRDWIRDHIFGIEKDYRLARVSKIALFMNGAGEGNIVFGDGLENDKTREIENGTFSILVANPPYSVKAFKSHLKLKNNEFELLDRISNDGSEIEVLFVERIAQLLKPGGVAAVILPSSILSNNSGSYIGAREVLLRNFFIKAIVQFGSKTFGATGTNTVVLFLRKYMEPPKLESIADDSVTNIFNNEPSKDWPDQELLSDYLMHIGVDEVLYKNFIKQEASLDDLKNNEYMRILTDAFDDSAVYKNLTRKKSFKNLSTTEKDNRVRQAFYPFAHNIEREKLFYFAMVKDQKTLICTAPTSNTEQKKFLGYDWSNRKGNEGIQVSNYGGQLFDPEKFDSTKHVASYIREHFNENLNQPIDKGLSALIKVLDTKDMINFHSSDFSKSISLTQTIKERIISKYLIVCLKDFDDGAVVIKKGTSITKDQADISGRIKVVAGGQNFAYYHDKPNRKAEVVTISASGAYAGFVNYYDEDIFASDCTTIQAASKEKTKFLYYFLKSRQEALYALQRGSGQPHVYPKDIKQFKVPEPPLKIMKDIVDACEIIEQQYNTTRMQIEEYNKQIQDIFDKLDVAKIPGGGGTD